MDGTIVQQGRFTSDGTARTIALRSDVDWMMVYNYTQAAANAASTGYKFYWQRGLAAGDGFEYQSNGASTAIDLTVLGANGGGFTLIDTSDQTPGARLALTGNLTAANPPVVNATNHTFSVGDIVRLSNLDNQPQIAGLDFTVTAIVAGASFTIGNINLANSTASTAGFYRKIPNNPIFYPRRRYITYVSQATANAAWAKIYMSVTHGFTVGQEVRLRFPGGEAVWENFAQLDGVSATVMAVNEARAGNEPNNGGTANNIVVDVDVSGFGNWNVFGAANNQAYPPSGDVPFSPAQVAPLGEDTPTALSNNVDVYGDATDNQALIGIQLGAGQDAPAGQNNDVIYWVAGKSFRVDNE